MIAGSIYLVFIADTFIGPFQGFLITLGADRGVVRHLPG